MLSDNEQDGGSNPSVITDPRAAYIHPSLDVCHILLSALSGKAGAATGHLRRRWRPYDWSDNTRQHHRSKRKRPMWTNTSYTCTGVGVRL